MIFGASPVGAGLVLLFLTHKDNKNIGVPSHGGHRHSTLSNGDYLLTLSNPVLGRVLNSFVDIGTTVLGAGVAFEKKGKKQL